MKSIKFSLVCLFLFFLPRSLTFAQVKFGTSSNGLAHESALLELESSTQGLLLPRMTTEARLAIPQPAQGLLVFDTNLKATYDDISNINHALAGKVSGAMFSQLSNQVTDNYNAIQNKVSLSDYVALKTNVNTKASLQQLNTLANDISTTYNLVQDKADQSALEQKLNKNGPAIFSGTLSITQDAKIEGNLLLGTELSGGGIVPAAGSVTIQNSKALASSRIFITLNALPSNGNCTVAVTQKADGEFTVSSNSNCDTALSFDYLLINSIQAAQGNNCGWNELGHGIASQ